MFAAAHKEKGYHTTEEYDDYEEDYDEYEEEASEQDGEDEHEAPKPTKEEQDFLKLREQLKDRIRKNLKKQNAGAFRQLSQTQEKKRTTANNTFGSFFGPSHPVIASRVIEESRSIRETKHIMANISSSAPKKRDATSSAAMVLHHQHQQKPAVVNAVKNKAQALKDMRDYSFLLSDDTDDLPTAKEQPAFRNVSAPKSDDRTAQVQPKSKLPMGKPAKLASVANGLKKPDPSKQNTQSKSGLAKEPPLKRPMPASAEPRKVFSGAVGNGSSKQMGTNTSQRTTVGNGSSKPVGTNMSQRNAIGNSSSKPMRTNTLQRNTVGNGSSKPMGTKTLQRNAVGNSSSKPVGTNLHRNVPSQVAGVNRPPSKVVNDPRLKKDLSSAKPLSSAQKHYPEQKRPTQGLDRGKITMKQPMPPSKSQPAKQNLSRGNVDDRPKRRPSARDLSDEEDVDYRSLIRGMFGYNPNKYAGMDEDDSDMEVGFDVIQEEEWISSKIAKEEDEEQLRLIEEEEERERRMRMKKKQRHS